MRSFIFITTEGFTYQNKSESAEPDVENCQVIGYSDGLTPEDAFSNLLKNNEYLYSTSFDEIICLELANEERKYFYLQEVRNSQ